ncbi:unnamed protein product [Camellia sinensis]
MTWTWSRPPAPVPSRLIPEECGPWPRSAPLPFLISITCSFQLQDHPTTNAAQSHDHLFNFAPGPAILPENVLKKLESKLYNWRNSSMSVMEISHRGKEFLAIIQKPESDLHTLLHIPFDYAVLFLQGGATTQFAAFPLNICKPNDSVDYFVTGSWGDKAFKESTKYCKPNVIWSGKSEKYTKISCFDELEQNVNARYLYICSNETIHRVEFKNYPIPKNNDVLLVADMSSNFCSKPVDVTKFGGLIGNAQEITLVMLDYKIHADNNSLYNTPPCYGIYMCGLVFEHLLAQGGLVEVEKKNMKKARILYDAIDESDGFYRCPVEKTVRSLMNVPFTLEKSELEAEFIQEVAKEKMVQLKGHRSVGGMRASISNAMPLAGVKRLVAFLKDFQARHV